MGNDYSMQARLEITAKYARDYRGRSKAEKSLLLDEVIQVSGWSRDNARRRLSQAARPRAVKRQRRQRGRKYSFDALKILQKVWAFSGYSCGKYLVISMPTLLESLERHKELVPGKGRYSVVVRGELLSMSGATIDRYLVAAKERDPLRGKSTTKPSTLLRSSIQVRKAGDEVEDVPGFFEGDTVAHCGPTLRGEFARTLNLTDMQCGWVFTRAIRNNASVHMIKALQAAVEGIPYQVTGLDFDNGSEFMNHAVIQWAVGLSIFFTRSRPYKKNDQATIESKNNHLVRRHGFYWRYDTADELTLLNQLWPLVNDRMNYFTPTKKPVGWDTTKTGRRKRVYDTPRTPLDRLLAAGILSPAQESELRARRNKLNPAELARGIQSIQDRLTGLAQRKTETLQESIRRPLPATTENVKTRRAG